VAVIGGSDQLLVVAGGKGKREGAVYPVQELIHALFLRHEPPPSGLHPLGGLHNPGLHVLAMGSPLGAYLGGPGGKCRRHVPCLALCRRPYADPHLSLSGIVGGAAAMNVDLATLVAAFMPAFLEASMADLTALSPWPVPYPFRCCRLVSLAFKEISKPLLGDERPNVLWQHVHLDVEVKHGGFRAPLVRLLWY